MTSAETTSAETTSAETQLPPTALPDTPQHVSSPPAAAVYAERVTALRAREKRLEREHVRLGYVRLAFGVAVLVLLLPPIPVALVPLFAFGIAARAHDSTLARLAATRRALAFYAHAQARLEERPSALTVPEPQVDRTQSLFADDLDLFGDGSLFTLLCEARTSLGRDLLARWLLQPASPAEVQRRQTAVAELRTALPLREALAEAPGPGNATLDRDALVAWGAAIAVPLPRAFVWVAPLLVCLTLLAGWRFAASESPLLLIGILIVNAAFTFRYRGRYNALFGEAERASRALRTVAALLRSLEETSFASGELQGRSARLRGGPVAASRALAQLHTLGQWADARANYIVRILDIPLLYSLQLGLALERWRTRFGPQLPTWLDTLAEFEALLSIAGYSFEHPDDSFPEFAEPYPGTEVGARFIATELGHPLLPRAVCVRNDVSLDSGTHLMLVSGSNMSGKSTLLRAVGINVVLAFAGAPVRARTLVVSRLTLTASIQVNDSLQAGRSRFYAEILRLRAITEAAKRSAPALFLIDEILSGTNSSDRLAGARGLVQELLRYRAIGLLSTHDLALTAMGEERSGAIRNVHFQDDVVEGELRFDYTLREGPVQRSNGLALMRLIGLEV